MALLVHVYWFHKFVQQQLRYYHASHAGLSTTATTDAVNVIDEKPAVISVNTGEESLKKKMAGIVCEYEVTVPVLKSEDDSSKAPESPTASNDTFGMELPQIQVNSSRHRRPRVVRLPSGQSIASLASFESSITDKGDASPSAADVVPTTSSPPAIIFTTSATAAAASRATTTGAKTMKQLLAECSDDDISTYKFPIHSNKTLSALARKPLNSGGNQSGLSGGADGLGVSRLSRASSMRDSKRRIALGSVQFAEPKATKKEPAVKTDEETEENEEAVIVAALKKKCSRSNVVEGDATVVMRPRRSSPSRDGDYGFGTIRVSRGGVVAVNA